MFLNVWSQRIPEKKGESFDVVAARCLAAQAQSLDQILIAGSVFSVKVVKQLASLINHSQQTTA